MPNLDQPAVFLLSLFAIAAAMCLVAHHVPDLVDVADQLSASLVSAAPFR